MYKVIFLELKRGVQGNCVLGVKKSCTDLAKFVLSSGVQGVDFGCTKSRIRKISSGVVWGLDVDHEDRTRIKSLVFAFALILSFYSVHFLSYKLFVIEILLTLLISILVFVLPSCSAY